MANIEMTYGDLTEMDVDAIVCPAHKHLTKGRGLSTQIYEKAGESLAAECIKAENCKIGEAKITSAGDLPADYIIHTVTRLWTGGDQWGANALEQLSECYESVIKTAIENNITSLFFPALSAGTNKMPQAIAAHQGLDVLYKYADKFERLGFCLHRESTLQQWRSVESQFYSH